MARDKKLTFRRSFTTTTIVGADPTTIVEWAIFGTNPDGSIDKANKVVTEEFQGLYSAKLVLGSVPGSQKLSAEVARTIHEQLEAEWDREIKNIW